MGLTYCRFDDSLYVTVLRTRTYCKNSEKKKKKKIGLLKFFPKHRTIWFYNPEDTDGMENSVDLDQTAPIGANWSGSSLFVQT